MGGPKETLIGLALALPVLAPPPLQAQTTAQAATRKLPAAPTISTRYFAEGSARIKVTGAFRIDGDVAVNTTASYADGEVTWLQFGASGSAEPNALLTYGEGREVGINVSLGRKTATADGSLCSGETTVSATAVTGQYSCVGITSYDPATGKLNKVDIAIRFTTRSAKP